MKKMSGEGAKQLSRNSKLLFFADGYDAVCFGRESIVAGAVNNIIFASMTGIYPFL